ncbi:MAG: trypsin-like peptidase domain-containing protein, partial [Bacteroidales bacterium]|nr:trypsin-like peptidase domain-containing protein [Bacteroidales bacterium]
MTGYNLGPILAITEEGVKAQFNQGTISQKTDERIMYSIPALPGSSGSPVVNHNGQLVAINYAGLSGTQNFNYGIRVKYLKDLIAK